MKQIFVCSRAVKYDRPAMWIKLKEQDKWPINSSWIYEARPEQTVCMKELWDRIIQEIKSCAGLVLYLEKEDLPLQGSIFEIGIAACLNLPICVVFPDIQKLEEKLDLLGSWAHHRSIRFYNSVEEAFEFILRD